MEGDTRNNEKNLWKLTLIEMFTILYKVIFMSVYFLSTNVSYKISNAISIFSKICLKYLIRYFIYANQTNCLNKLK